MHGMWSEMRPNLEVILRLKSMKKWHRSYKEVTTESSKVVSESDC